MASTLTAAELDALESVWGTAETFAAWCRDQREGPLHERLTAAVMTAPTPAAPAALEE